jgi:hypothetical protein
MNTAMNTEPKGWIASIVGTLPPAFLALAATNIGMLYFVLKAIESQSDQRMQILNKVIDACLNK